MENLLKHKLEEMLIFDRKILEVANISYDYLESQQAKAREVDENGNVFKYEQFPKSSVKYFTDALFGFMPECTDIVETIQLMNFLLFDGQANAGK